MDNSSPETTTDDSDPLDWTGPDKGNVQVLQVVVTLVSVTVPVKHAPIYLLLPAGVAKAGRGDRLLQDLDRLLCMLLLVPRNYTLFCSCSCAPAAMHPMVCVVPMICCAREIFAP